MEQNLIQKVLNIDGMTCINCQIRIENSLKKLEGVKEAEVSYSNSTAKVTYHPQITSLEKMIETIEELDYHVKNEQNSKSTPNKNEALGSDKLKINQLIGIGIILFAGYLIINHTIGFNFIPNVSQNMGYGILFIVGLITSLHCVAMCRGINLSQCVSYQFTENDTGKWSKLEPSLKYNAGRVISYTIIGGIVGALGSVSNLRHNFLSNFSLSLLLLLLTPFIFGTANVDAKAAAIPLEMFVSLIGIILLIPAFLPEQQENVRSVVESKAMSSTCVYGIRICIALLSMLVLIAAFTLYMNGNGCEFDIPATVFGTFSGGLFLGVLGLFAYELVRVAIQHLRHNLNKIKASRQSNSSIHIKKLKKQIVLKTFQL